MSSLTPELKRLMRWAQQAPRPAAPEMRPGFSARVVALRDTEVESSNGFALWQRAIWGSGWAAAVVILLGIVLLTAQKLRLDSPYDFSPAYQIVSVELVP